MNTKERIKTLYFTGAVSAGIVILLTLTDIIAGSITGGDLTSIPPSAEEKFLQLNENTILGLYNLDLLNLVVSVVMIPAILALCLALRNDNEPGTLLGLVIFITGTTIFISNNAALPMLDLSRKYFAAISPDEQVMIAAAGEALIAKGAHGSPGVFPGFVLITISELVISVVMLRGLIFSRATALFGIIGTTLLILYLVLVTFWPAAKENAVMFAAPGGISSLIWMILFTGRLFRLAGKSR